MFTDNMNGICAMLFDRTERSVNQLKILEKEWLADSNFWPLKEILRSLEERGRWLFVFYRKTTEKSGDKGACAATPNKPIGVVFFGAEGELFDLYFIHVAQTERRKGIGKALMKWWIEESQKQTHYNVSGFVLEVKHTNNAALALYDKMGFCRIGTRKKYYSTGEDAISMQLRPSSL